MDTKDEILMEAFLLRASPETVFEWLKAWPQRTPGKTFWCNHIPEAIESQLLGRNNEIIDLGLAAWGTCNETLATLYQRWCARSAVDAWPPQPSTFAYAVLAAILANVNAAGVIFGLDYQKDDTEDFDWLIEHGDNNLLYFMHSNIGPAIGLLRGCAARSGAYGRIDDRRWLQILVTLGENKRLHVPAKEYHDSPDLPHWEIHEAFVEAARISPKTPAASAVFWGIFVNLPTIATAGAYIKDEVLNAAVSAWNVEIANNDPDDMSSFLSKSDALPPAERVQFHLLRHYCSWIHLDPNDPNRVRRLAAYAKNPVAGDHGLVVGDFQKYADRDGPAFVYATSLNRHIWRNKTASEAMRWDFPKPEDPDDIKQNRAACRAAVGTEDESTDDNLPEKEESVAEQTLKAVAQLMRESNNIHEYLKVKIDRVEGFVLWGGLVLVVLLLFVFFKH